jgi:16S rRNA (cytidine1402-2'-O)-methyltransferase
MTDCGTPAVSDPGSTLVAAVAAAGFEVQPLPGASAMTAALSVSGFGGRHVLFAGFPGKKKGRMIREFEELARFDGIIILYESPHRIRRTLDLLSTVFPGQQAVVCRELTKIHEECVRFALTPPCP